MLIKAIEKSKDQSKISRGFTLIEMMLVLVIISIIIWAGVGYIQQRTLQTRMDRTSIYMQQILNAGMAYYVTHGEWPDSIATLQSANYLPQGQLKNPWNQDYGAAPFAPNTTPPSLPNFYVYTAIRQAGATTGSAAAAANVIAGTLPLSYTTTSAGTPPPEGSACAAGSTTCYVVTRVNIPGQELSNARAVNFAGLYRHGGCIPVPQCPSDPSGAATMTPQVMVVPVSVSGMNDPNSQNVYPISSFTAYATGQTPNLGTSPPACKTNGNVVGGLDCATSENIGERAQAYWRACLQIVTEKGNVQTTRTDDWGTNVTLMAITRCAVQNEPAGSTFNVFGN